MLENGKKTKQMVTESINILMGLNMKECGKMIYSMVLDRKFGLMEVYMKEIMLKGKKKEKGIIII